MASFSSLTHSEANSPPPVLNSIIKWLMENTQTNRTCRADPSENWDVPTDNVVHFQEQFSSDSHPDATNNSHS